ncbi:hypothetical protein MNBD_NITROSPINAE02-462 [hydrothermal vent metagenome]|uniref:Uncharacterized protein n=1 Tax=hydrothermal vent metagenome TaxID=652676 RepID=A0A3B1BYW1_9ZZZZ
MLIVAFSAAPAEADETAYEIEFWQSVKNSRDPADLDEYLRAYPKGKYAGLARNRIKRLLEGKTSGPAPAFHAPAVRSEPIEPAPQEKPEPVVAKPAKPAAPPAPAPAPEVAQPEPVSSTDANLVFYIQDTCGYCDEWVTSAEEDCNEWVLLNRVISIDGKPVITSLQPGEGGVFGGVVELSDFVIQAGSQTVSPGPHTISYECQTDGRGFSKSRSARQSVSAGAGETKHVVIKPVRNNVFSSDMKISASGSPPGDVHSK